MTDEEVQKLFQKYVDTFHEGVPIFQVTGRSIVDAVKQALDEGKPINVDNDGVDFI